MKEKEMKENMLGQVRKDDETMEDAVERSLEQEAVEEEFEESLADLTAGMPDLAADLPEMESPEEPEKAKVSESPEEPVEAEAPESSEEPAEAEGPESPEEPENPAQDPAGDTAAGNDAGKHLADSQSGHKPTVDGKKQEPGNKHRAFGLTVLIICLILGGAYGLGYNFYKTHFMSGTVINGYECGGLTVEEVEDKFAEAAENYVLNIRFRGGSTQMLSARDMGFRFQSDGSIAALMQSQDHLLWLKYFFQDSVYEISPGGDYDPELLEQALSRLPELQEDAMEEPKNAYIHFESGDDEEDGRFVIVPDTEGSTIDPVQLAAGVGDAAAAYTDLVDAEDIAGAYVAAEVQADNANLTARCQDLNDIVSASITYVLPDGDTVKLNSDVMKDWLVKDKRGKLVKDEEVWDEKLWEFLDKLAGQTNTIGMSRRFDSTLRGTITVSGGDYGYMVNQVTEHDKLVDDLEEGKKETRKPDYYITPYNEETENDGIGTTYIEADLSAQHIWCYVNGTMVMESDCVSGDTTNGHGTPTGVFGIMFMKKDTVLQGAMQSNGEREYETKVGYWMPFYADCGFHDAWWRTAFGGTIYQGDGSHGCINLPVDAARTLFSYCDDKMPVIVYY